MAAKVKVSGATICGRRKQAKDFTVTGPLRGHYAVSICDKPKQHSAQEHEDSTSGEKWRG